MSTTQSTSSSPLNLWGGSASSESRTGTAIVNPAQANLLKTLQMRAYLGNLGDFGGGTAFRQGQSNLAQAMADRGIRPDSGVYNAALGNVAAQAQMQDTNALRQYMLGLLGTPIQTVQTDDWISPPPGGPGMTPEQWQTGMGQGFIQRPV